MIPSSVHPSPETVGLKVSFNLENIIVLVMVGLAIAALVYLNRSGKNKKSE